MQVISRLLPCAKASLKKVERLDKVVGRGDH